MKHLINGIICAFYSLILQSILTEEPLRLMIGSGTLFLILIPCIIFSVFSEAMANGIKKFCKYVVSPCKKNPVQP